MTTSYPSRSLDRQVLARERRTSATRVIRNDGLDSSIQPRSQQEKSANHDKDMDDSHDASRSAAEQLSTVHLPVRHSEENESEEGVEGSTQQTQEVTHAGNNLGKDKGDGPDTCHDGDPGSPTDDRVGMGVVGLAHNAVVHELCRHVRVDDTDNQSGHNDKGKRGLLVCHNTKTSECRGSSVLSEVSEANGRRNDEQESGDTCKDSQRLGEVLRPLHL